MERLLFKNGYVPACPPEHSLLGIKKYRKQNVTKNFALMYMELGKRQ